MGTVKSFDASKGYGFITRAWGEDVFIHHTDIVGDVFKTLLQGDKVEFEVEVGLKGLRARNVKKIK
ncbi:MAG: cold-shock protein [Candidatus Hodarchaeota archaeon]